MCYQVDSQALKINGPGGRTQWVPGRSGGYGAGQILEAAVDKANSVDKDSIRKALAELETTSIFGLYKVDDTGKQIGKPGYAIQWINGVRHIVLPTEVATHDVVYPFKPWDDRRHAKGLGRVVSNVLTAQSQSNRQKDRQIQLCGAMDRSV